MARDYLTQAQKDVLATARRRTTLSITLGDGTPIDVATGDVDFGGKIYLPKLKPVDALNLELTGATEGIELQISNVTLVFGQTLINTPDVLTGTTAVLGTYFYDPATGVKWHDEKITGEIEVGDIDGDSVKLFFTSKPDAVVYGGTSIVSLFPDSAIPAASLPDPPPPIYNDIDPRPPGRGEPPPPAWDDGVQNGGRYILPEFQPIR